MARAISLLMASALTLGLLFLPAMRGGELTAAGHGLLSPLLMTICAGFIHGLGYKPRNRVLGCTIRPAILWPAMLGLGVAWAHFS